MHKLKEGHTKHKIRNYYKKQEKLIYLINQQTIEQLKREKIEAQLYKYK